MIFLFEDYTLNTDRRELRRGAASLQVEPQVFDLLTYLIRNRERVVSKDDLITSIWGGRAISDSTLTTRLNSVRCAIGDSGAEQRLIRTFPRIGIRFVGKVSEPQTANGATQLGAAAETPRPAFSLPDLPSIAVLPFTNIGGDAEQEYFADGVVEEIITALSGFPSLFVIARNSSFTYRGRLVDVKEVGRELGVRYAVEGSVRHAGDRVRITAQLIDATSGAHLWADRFEGKLQDVFDLQDRVTASVVTAIAPKLERTEIERARHKPTRSLNAYDYFLRGMASFYRHNKEANNEALRLFHRAIEIDPQFAAAYGMAARCYSQRHGNRWMIQPSQEIAEAIRLARQAVELGCDNAVALCNGGWVLDYLAGDPDAGAVFIDRARKLSPNLALAWISSGWVRFHLGDPETAIAHFAKAMRLSPLDPLMFSMQTGTAAAHFSAGRNDEAASWAERAWREKPSWLQTLRIAAASHALAGRLDRAQEVLIPLRELDPEIRISNIRDVARFARPEDLARFEEGLRKVGVRE